MDKYKAKYKDLLQFVKELQSEVSSLQASASGTQLSPHAERIYNLISDKLGEKKKKKKRLSSPDTSATVTSPRQLKNSTSSTTKEAINAEKSSGKVDMRSSAQVAVPTVLLLGSANSVKLKSVEDRVIPPISTTQVQTPKQKDTTNNEKSNQNANNKEPAATQPASTGEISQQKSEEKTSNRGVDSSTSSSAGTPLGTPGTSGNNTPVGSPSASSFFTSTRPTSAMLSRSASGEYTPEGAQDATTVQNAGGFLARQPSKSVIGERQNSGWNFSSRGRQERPAEVQIGAKIRTSTSENIVLDSPTTPRVTPVLATENVPQSEEKIEPKNDEIKQSADTAVKSEDNAPPEIQEQELLGEAQIVAQPTNEISKDKVADSTEQAPSAVAEFKLNNNNNNRNSLNFAVDFQSPFDDYNPLEETIIMPSTTNFNDEPNPMEETIIMPSTSSFNDEPNPMEETIIMPTSVDGSAQQFQLAPSTSPENLAAAQLQPRYSVSFNSRKSISPGASPRITLIGAARNRGDSNESSGSPSDSPKQRAAAKTYSSDTLVSPKGDNKIIRIYLPNRLMHSAYLPKDKVLKDVLQKLIETRSDLTDPNLVAKDVDGTPLDTNLTIGQLPSEMLFGGARESEQKSTDAAIEEERAANRAKRKTFAPIKGLAKNLTLRSKKNRDGNSMEVDSISEVKSKSHLTHSALDVVSTAPRRKKSVLVDALVDLPKFQRRPDSSDMSSHSNVDSLIDRPAFQNEENSAPGTPEVPVAVVPKPKKFEHKIQYILDEIVKTEIDYRNDLIKYMDIFKLPLRKEEIVTPEEEQQLFINIEDIVVLADQMTAMFEVMVDVNNPDTCQVGEVFIQMLPQFEAYKKYCGAQQAANKLYGNLIKNNKRFKKFIDMAKVQANLQDLASFLIKPLQRITKYPLLLNELLKELPQENPDVSKIIEAKTAIERLVNATNETKRVADAVEKIHTLDEQLNWDKYVSEGGEKIVLSDIMDRVSYIRQGDLKLLSKSGEQKLFGLLFNSFLLVTKVDGEEYKVRYVVPMQNLYVWNLDPAEAPDAKFGFALVKSDSKFRLNLCGISEADKHDWMTKINQCIFIKFISYKK